MNTKFHPGYQPVAQYGDIRVGDTVTANKEHYAFIEMPARAFGREPSIKAGEQYRIQEMQATKGAAGNLFVLAKLDNGAMLDISWLEKVLAKANLN
jgi:hypothetical protein